MPARPPISRSACAASSSMGARPPTSRGASSAAPPCVRGGGSTPGAGSPSPSTSSPPATSTMPGWPPPRPRSGPPRSAITWCWHRAHGRSSRPTCALSCRSTPPGRAAPRRGSSWEPPVAARLGRRWLADGGLSLAGPLVVVAGQPHARLQPGALAEVWFEPRPAFALFAGGSLRTEVAPTFSLVTVVPRAGMRSALAHGLWMAFLAEVPVAGEDRTNVIASLFLGWAP